ncbi:MAG: YdeI/OmpD-associated family protein [Flavobacteriales bacterium]
MPAKRKLQTWRFTSPLERMAGSFGWHYLEFPHDVHELFGKRGEVRVKCVINGVAVDRALMPTKSGMHIIILGADLRRQTGVRKPGDLAKVELWLDPEPDRIDVPEDLAETLDFMPEVKVLWDKLLPGVKRNMCYWVRTGKTAPTRAKRIAELIRRLENREFERGRKQNG